MNSLNENHWQARSELLLGKEKLQKLEEAHVLVIGLGGVGASATEYLARAGIGQLSIADSDHVSLTNINRQLLALHSTIGQDKTMVLKNRLLDINPALKINTINSYLKDEALNELVAKPYDFIVDAIDTLSPKVFLIYNALKNNNQLVSAMGAGAKMDPSKIQIADISETHTCHLALQLRKRLSKLGVKTGFKAVFSSEKIIKEAMVYTDGERNKKTNVGSISYMPALFGGYCASVVITSLTDK
jgi:tRNA A37 threonylcarbamoyladenosine dehydratase